MSILVYAVADGPIAAAVETEARDVPLRSIDSGGLFAIVRDANPSMLEPTEENMRAYAETVERAMDGVTLLPARFGTVLGDDAAARTALDAGRERLQRRLDRVRGAVEIGIRIERRAADRTTRQQVQPASDEPGSGIAYMRERLEADRDARRLADELAPLRAIARESRIRLAPSSSSPLSASFLIDRETVDAFTAHARRLASRLERTDLVITGPWPPYSFAEEVSE